MADLQEAMVNIKNTYSFNIEFYGIIREYFPKWIGWDLLDNNITPSYDMVVDFYEEFFWSKLKCNNVDSQYIANLIFIFSSTNGKKKLIDKLDRIFSTNSNGTMTNEMVNLINSSEPKFLFLYLYAELCEFCIMLDKKKDFCKLLKVYNQFCSKL